MSVSLQLQAADRLPAKAGLHCMKLLLALATLTLGQISATAEEVLTPREIQTEQRVFQSHLDTAAHDLEQAQRSYQTGTYNLAWVNVANAGAELDKAKPKMEGHPQRIAACSIIFNASARRETMRDSFYEIRDRFYDINRKVIALEIDVGGKLGIDIPYVRQLREAINLLLPHIKDPAMRSRLEALLSQMDDAIRSGDVNRVQQILKSSEDLIKSVLQSDPSLRDVLPSETRESLESGGSEHGKAAAKDSQGGGQSSATGGSAGAGAGGSGSGSAGSQANADAAAAQAAADAAAARSRAAAANQTPATYTGTVEIDGIVIDFRGGKGVEAEYIGERGARLVREKEKILKSLPPDLQVADGAVRQWNLRLTPMPGSIEQTATSYKANLQVTDPSNAGSYAIARWRVLDASGTVVQESADGSNEFQLNLSESGSYTVDAQGETDWGSSFTLRQTIEINL